MLQAVPGAHLRPAGGTCEASSSGASSRSEAKGAPIVARMSREVSVASAGREAVQPVAAMEHEPASVREPGERIGGEDRGVAVARGDIPPVAADHLDVGRLQRLGEDDAAAGREEGRHVLQAGAGRDGVLDHLEAGDQAELPLRARGAGERVVVGDVGEAVAGHALGECARAGAVVEHVDVAPGAEAIGQHGGDAAGADVGVFGVDPGVVCVVDVGGEFVRGPVVEEAGEDEAAVLAAAVVDVDAGEAEGEGVGGRAVFVEVETVERRGEPATKLACLALTQDGVWA